MSTKQPPTKPATAEKRSNGNSSGWNEWLCTFAKGEHRYCDTTLDTYEDDRNRAMGQRSTQRSPLIKDMKFSVKVFTAIANASKAEVRYLLCVTRTA